MTLKRILIIIITTMFSNFYISSVTTVCEITNIVHIYHHASATFVHYDLA